MTLRQVLKTSKHKDIIIYPPTIDWNIPLIQRPQHLSRELSKLGFLYFYCTTNTYDKVNGYIKIGKNLILNNKFDEIINTLSDGWIILNAAHPYFTIEQIKSWKKGGFKIIYEYIDKLDKKLIPNKQIRDFIINRHKQINDTLIDLAIVSSKKLINDIDKHLNPNKIIYIPNGVDFNHFNLKKKIKKPIDIKKISSPIIGYYGALAKWIDYKLLKSIVIHNPKWNIVLIGWDFDNSIKNENLPSNIHFLGIKNYKELPTYSSFFDVAIIPFKKGEIAKATSPLKLFEYMSSGKQVVCTSDLLECSNFDGVYMSKNNQEFINKIKYAISKRNNKKLIYNLKKQAKNNTWKIRAKTIDDELIIINKSQNTLTNKYYKLILYTYKNLKIILKKIKANLNKNKFETNNWHNILKISQSEILKYGNNKYYNEKYQKEEYFYWSYIPKWIYELKNKKTIHNCLDIGSAYGTLSLFCHKIFNCKNTCTDFISIYFPKFLIKKYNFKFFLNNIELEKLPIKNEFDIILLTEVIEHFNFNALPTLQKIYKALSKNGYLFISTPNSKTWGITKKYYTKYSELPMPNIKNNIVDDHVWQFNTKEILDLLKKAKFKIIKIDYAPGTIHNHINIMAQKN
ncbi:MAG: methyltransferase domain-containing protein [Candidatus Margulisiibacteriota bacterium]|jgi:hypothetical protein